ncbi:hypothetical protein FVEN_g6485 [Fusarium venenatum]|uniref:Transmembrane protein n=1 Tax=Fusarium venenatum TaxID=56646 RepID=A0A2L2SSY7_9HYPO|nr:uncharacterized protein FVRRES_04760 [Fusarium venenatum]KAG8355736.1 hypothetical protein FVEN_g6485 [Fusarium venenatum]KAH6991910.1 hypothetical protein EDB82DRAFT_535079 [Fusarium venenatum]CEI60324.1 unnamed protein product [Fusarium venenatum]
MTTHWYYPSAMTAFMILGTAFSIGHHCYYASLDGKPANNQEWVIRFGTAFSFLVKACYASSLTIAIKQLVWARIRRTACSILTIDALFSITTDITSLFTGGLWRRTPSVAVIVSTDKVISPQPCNIPTLDFDKKFDRSWKSPQSPLANYNVSRYQQPQFPEDDESPWEGHTPAEMAYGGPSSFVEKLIRRVFIGGQILDTPSICGPNCTYRVDVPGIGYSCEVLPSNIDLIDAIDEDIPAVAAQYHSFIAENRNILGLVFTRENQSPDGKENISMEYFRCEPRRVVHDVKFSFVNNVRTLQFGKEIFVGKVPWIVFNGNKTLAMSYAATNFWAYQGLAHILRKHMAGTIWWPLNSGTASSTLLGYTSLVSEQTNKVNPNETLLQGILWPRMNFRDGLVELARNFSMSLLADPSLYIYTTIPGKCQISDWVTRWEYNPVPMWIAYGSLCLIGFVGIVLGALSITFNGCTSDMAFSKVLCTTRNTALDETAMHAHFGSHPLPNEV